ncbi:hypothetical protein AA101099_2380 [Neoasaia chiangmaiensis NBRC 101099]|uniref:Integrase DNA-binding domain-containing protein n=1 Tax=Neoasaia chiangmaiensis TaxID=320497 RepID=A0A1U9KSE4_9PROT|nr:Arm DNA-binding domain-containing protein [Neoasaia chiangmaiensis]AQS88682.1 hypothetical protein A0U93_12990 [Neoasaia chiangmaiensis]GBR41053.1 hypothetical protein AA101099_2380 [Neoasaia chiangmaiensis NBRC 101099]GEN13631.1 hypothetical protein NCH01_00620 [Neoasaia chiangmaiensis]
MARNAAPCGKQYKLADSNGLYLLMRPAGGKLWHFKFRAHGKEKRLAFKNPEVTLAWNSWWLILPDANRLTVGIKSTADGFAVRVMPVMREIQAGGVVSLNGVAGELTKRGH